MVVVKAHGPHYYIVVYDAEVKRGVRVLKVLRKYLHWVQNSVFEGVLSPSQFSNLKQELKRVMDPERDSIIIYRLKERWFDREVLGIEKGSTDRIL